MISTRRLADEIDGGFPFDVIITISFLKVPEDYKKLTTLI